MLERNELLNVLTEEPSVPMDATAALNAALELCAGYQKENEALRTQLAESQAEAERWKKVADQAIEQPEWTCQEGYEYFGQEIVTFKSGGGEWAYAYGTMLGEVLAIETLVTGFKTEEEAQQAAYDMCREYAQYSACEFHDV